MYVCICHAVTDTQVKSAIASGADTTESVTRMCRAGGDCGSCLQHIEDLLEEHAESAPRGLPVLRPCAA